MTLPSPPSDRTARRDRAAFNCPRCDAFAKQTWLMMWRTSVWGGESRERAIDGGKPSPKVDPDSPPSRGEVVETLVAPVRFEGEWAMALCEACKDYSVWRSDDLIFPQSSKISAPSPDMPGEVRDLYNEAREVMSVSRRAGAALARATLERLLKVIDPEAPPRAKLDARIERVLPDLSSSLGQMLTIIRHVGNKALHVEEEPDKAVVLVMDEEQTEIVELIFESINDLVDERITKPNTTSRLLGLLPKRVLDNVKGLKK